MWLTKAQLKKIIIENLEFPTQSGFAVKSKKDRKYAYPSFDSKEELKRFILKRMQDYGRLASPDTVRQFGTEYDDYSTEEGKFLRDMRKYPKAIWNNFADHEYFKTGIAKLHQVSYAGTSTTGQAIDKRYLKGGKTELSVWGTASSNPLQPDPAEMRTVANEYLDVMPRLNIYLALQGRVTWAGDFDAFTEELSSHRTQPGSEGDNKRKTATKATAGALPKRPGGITLRGGDRDFKDFPIILDEEDVVGMEQGLIDEMIIDNWQIGSTILYVENLSDLSIANQTPEQIADLVISHSAQTQKMSPFQKLLQAKKDGFPNPMICDFEAGRYYTGDELNRLFEKLESGEVTELEDESAELAEEN